MKKPYPRWILLSEKEIKLLTSLPEKFDPPVRVLNLGDMQGGSAILFALQGADVITVDSYSESKMKRSIENQRAYGVEDKIFVLRMKTDQAFEHFREVGAAPFDIIFVDADHSYASVMKDTANSLDFLKPEGLIAFHDTDQVEIQRAVKKFKNRITLIDSVDRLQVYKRK